MQTTKAIPAHELTPGDTVVVGLTHQGSTQLREQLLRTVSYVTDSGMVNRRNVPILAVYYAEGDTPEWGCGNTWAANSLVTVKR